MTENKKKTEKNEVVVVGKAEDVVDAGFPII